jgi:hypothetical protein
VPYLIPNDNPFAGNQNGYREEIWAYGFRNPWRFSFDRLTGQLWAGDVGQGAREEVDIIEKGKNYGWRIMEGFACYDPSTGCDQTGLTLPFGLQSLNGFSSRRYVYHGFAPGWRPLAPTPGTRDKGPRLMASSAVRLTSSGGR